MRMLIRPIFHPEYHSKFFNELTNNTSNTKLFVSHFRKLNPPDVKMLFVKW